MKPFLLASSAADVEGLLDHLPGKGLEHCRFLYLDTLPGAEQIFDDRGPLPARARGDGPVLRKVFLEDYMALLDALAEANGRDLHWWATDLASKNRFTSPLLPLLNVFARCLAAARSAAAEGAPLVLAGVPWPVILALKAAADRNGWDLRVVEGPLSRLGARLRGQWQAARLLLSHLRAALRRVRRPKPPLPGGWTEALTGRRPAYLVKSFVYCHSIRPDGSFDDPFFGPLAGFLKGNLDAVVLSLVEDFEADDWRNCVRDEVLPVDFWLSAGDVWRGFFEVALGRVFRPFRVPDGLVFLGADVTALVRECLASGGWRIQLLQYLHRFVGRRIAGSCRLVGLAQTFEGNPWERMLLAGIREASAEVPSFGYQHSVVPQAAAGVFVTQSEARLCPLPDSILTTGRIPAEIVRRYGRLPATRVRPCCALRYDYLSRQEGALAARKPGEPFCVLVALEGVWEVLPLVEYVLNEAPRCPGVVFRIRAHPILQLSRYLAALSRGLDPSGNVEESAGGPVSGDVGVCDAVLYWGTTMALEALMLGKPLIHFDRGDLPSFDPLFEFTAFKWTVSAQQAFLPVLDAIRGLAAEETAGRASSGREYIRAYFHPVSDEAMRLFLPEAAAGLQE